MLCRRQYAHVKELLLHEQELAAYDLLYGEENDIDTTAETHTSGCTEQVDGLPFYTIP